MTRTIDIGARVKKITKRKKSFPTRTVTSAKRAATYKFRGKMKNKVREFRASEALRSIFSHNNNGKTTNRKILGKGPPPSMVYIGNSEFLSDQSELKKLVDSIPMKFRGDEVVDPAKGFTRIGFKKLYRAKGGKAFVISILRLLKPLFEVYSVDRNDPLHLILSSGNTRPYHQDVQTGSNVYDESYKKDIDEYDWFCGKRYRRPANGLRVLIDLGSFNGSHKSRRFSFAKEKGKNNFLEIFTTTARVIAMNAGAAGSGRKSDIYHGRFGDGVTVQLDLVLKKKSGIHGKATKIGLGGVISALIEKFVNK